jgi:hypothetical protein
MTLKCLAKGLIKARDQKRGFGDSLWFIIVCLTPKGKKGNSFPMMSSQHRKPST